MAMKPIKLPDGSTVYVDENTTDEIIQNIAWGQREKFKDIFGGVTGRASEVYNQVISQLGEARSGIQTQAAQPPPAVPTFETGVIPNIQKAGEPQFVKDVFPGFEQRIGDIAANLPPIQTDPNFQKVIESIQAAGQEKLSGQLPTVEKLLSEQGKFIEPQVAAIRQRGEELAAGAQSEAMKRGLTGSDIEAAGMLGARQGAAAQEAQVRADYAKQASQTLAQLTVQAKQFDIQTSKEVQSNLANAYWNEIQARTQSVERRQQLTTNLSLALAESFMKLKQLDIQSNQQMYLNLAKAVGEKISSDKSLELAYTQLQTNLEIAKITGDKQAQAAAQQGIMGIIGKIVGTIGALQLGQPAIAATVLAS